MVLQSLQIENFKSFHERQTVELDDRFTVLVGENNAGKSACAAALALRFSNAPHLSEETVPIRRARHLFPSKFEARFRLTAAEFRRMLSVERSFRIVASRGAVPDPRADALRRWPEILSQDYVSVNATFEGSRNPSFDSLTFLDGAYPADPRSLGSKQLWHSFARPSIAEDFRYRRSEDVTETDESLERKVFRYCEGSIYLFHPERMNVGECPVGAREHLEPDASNLPEVLNALAANPFRMERYNDLVRQVLPQISRVTVATIDRGGIRLGVRVWRGDRMSERDDLAIPLQECGTGVSQVLAMLYVIHNADRPRTVVVDEPGSFLHPGALRSLMRVFREHDMHQYIIATHHPAVVVNALEPKVYVLDSKRLRTSIREVNTVESTGQRQVLDAIGADLGEVFGPKSIVWVEGKTEAQCFPLVLAHDEVKVPSWTAFMPVVATGDFATERKARLSTEIYSNLSKGIGIVPPALAFVLDAEGLSEVKQQKLREACGGRLEFIPVRMYENYLLGPRAISTVLSDAGYQVPEEWVRAFLDEAVADDDAVGPVAKTVDGAALLKSLFSEATENQWEYDKVRDGRLLTEAVLDHEAERFESLLALLKPLVIEGASEVVGRVEAIAKA